MGVSVLGCIPAACKVYSLVYPTEGVTLGVLLGCGGMAWERCTRDEGLNRLV